MLIWRCCCGFFFRGWLWWCRMRLMNSIMKWICVFMSRFWGCIWSILVVFGRLVVKCWLMLRCWCLFWVVNVFSWLMVRRFLSLVVVGGCWCCGWVFVIRVVGLWWWVILLFRKNGFWFVLWSVGLIMCVWLLWMWLCFSWNRFLIGWCWWRCLSICVIIVSWCGVCMIGLNLVVNCLCIFFVIGIWFICLKLKVKVIGWVVIFLLVVWCCFMIGCCFVWIGCCWRIVGWWMVFIMVKFWKFGWCLWIKNGVCWFYCWKSVMVLVRVSCGCNVGGCFLWFVLNCLIMVMVKSGLWVIICFVVKNEIGMICKGV